MPVNARRPPVAARRFGYIVAVAVTAAMLYIINVWPGWQEVPFFTHDTNQVLWFVNISLLVGIAVNLVYVAYDHPWLKSLGDLVTTAVGLVVLVRIWQVFPFDFGGYSIDWGLVARFVLVLAIVGSVVGIAVQFVSLTRRPLMGESAPEARPSGRAASSVQTRW
jgi:hypothetical protein